MDTPSTGHKILVVEDEAPMRRMLVGVLQQAGFTVLEAGTGQDGLDIALREHPSLVVTDNVMPKMNGLDMITEIRKDAWGALVPIILMTNVGSVEAVNKSLQFGGVDYLMKSDIQLDKVVAVARQRLGLV